MRLLYVNEANHFVFTEILHDPPPYAILSHTWSDYGELRYQEVRDGLGQEKEGYSKLLFCAERAKQDNLKHFWIDTCCIDKDNDAELATSIRSMFQWYSNAAVCYVYLADVSVGKRKADGTQAWHDSLRNCRWFKRGWTLQELIAPRTLRFYARGQFIGDRTELSQIIGEVTGIDVEALKKGCLEDYSHRTRLSWAAGRDTKVPEDLAYALMGICGVSMSPRYGEGFVLARRRLESKIMKLFGSVALEESRTAGSHAATAQEQPIKMHREALLESLKFDAMESRRITIKKALAKTCGWVLQHGAFLSWQRPESLQGHNGFLWIKGKPGAGKSVLIKFLDHHITKHKSEADICVSFYFNARGEQLEKTLAGMYRSLVVQLLQAVPETQAILDNYRPNHDTISTTEQLQRIITAIISKLKNRRVHCFVDALDECQQDDIESMVMFFQDLGQQALDNGTAINTCFASRHYPIYDIPTGLQLVLEDVSEHTDDLRKYVQTNLRVDTKKQSESTTNDILAKANGVFLWVVLVVDILNKEFKNGRIHAVRKKLEDIPPGLSELFKAILQRDNLHPAEFLLCLQWILFSIRPLELPEFYYGMMAGIDESNTLEWSADNVTSEQMHSYLLSSSKGFAELTKGKSPTVQFIHESVRDFLLKDNGLEVLSSGSSDHVEGRGHKALKQCCLRGLTSLDDSNSCLTDEDFQCISNTPATKSWRKWYTYSALRKKHSPRVAAQVPFLRYATACILHHADRAMHDTPLIEFFRYDLDLKDWLWKYNIVARYDVALYTSDVSLPYLCAERNLTKSLEVLVTAGFNLETPGQRYGSPLVATLATQSREAARLILAYQCKEASASWIEDALSEAIHDRAKYESFAFADTPWSWALHQGHEKLALLLLHAVCPTDLLEFSKHGRNALSLAAEGGRSKLVEHIILVQPKLLDRERSAITKRRPALGFAVIRNHVSVVELLLAKGVNPDAKRRLYADNTLLDAAGQGYTDVVKLLLDRGADVNAQGGHYGNALQAAAGRRIDIVKLLLDSGANVNAQGGYHGNALQAAAAGGRIDIVKLLLDSGANVNAQGGYHGNALQAAANLEGHTDVVQLLLDSGANINARDRCEGTALHCAIRHYNQKCTSTLLARGIDVHAYHDKYGTALHVAAKYNRVTGTMLLLSHGANVNEHMKDAGTALDIAIRDHREELVKLLLEHGAKRSHDITA